MRKIGPILAILSGTFAIAMSLLGILIRLDVLKEFDFIEKINKFTNKSGHTSLNALYYVSLATSVLTVLTGVFAFKKSRGFAAFILLALFAISLGLGIWAGIIQDSFPIGVIISLSVTGVATLGLLFGFISPKK